jgi:hypothetical protein
VVADVPDAESHYHAHEFLDATVQPKPIYISPNEVYGMHALLSQYQEKLVGVFNQEECFEAEEYTTSLLIDTMPCVLFCTSWMVYLILITMSSRMPEIVRLLWS